MPKRGCYQANSEGAIQFSFTYISPDTSDSMQVADCTSIEEQPQTRTRFYKRITYAGTLGNITASVVINCKKLQLTIRGSAQSSVDRAKPVNLVTNYPDCQKHAQDGQERAEIYRSRAVSH